jgi:subtilisin family serine protease
LADLSQFVKSYFILYSGDIRSALSSIGLSNIIILNAKNALLYAPENFNDALLNTIKQIELWRSYFPMSHLGTVTNNISSGVSVRDAVGSQVLIQEQTSYVNLTGRGVLIAIIDSGIDYTHPDFIYPNGNSKIIRLWDQENQQGTPPEGYLFGTEYTNERINEAIVNNDTSLSVDSLGYGTLSAGIAAGIGNVSTTYRGVAIGAELIVVKLKPLLNIYTEDRIYYSHIDLFAAIDYVMRVAQELNRPLVINLSIGGRFGNYSDTTFLNALRSQLRRGVVVVSGAGDDGNADIHYSGRFSVNGETQDVDIEVGEGQRNLDIYLSADMPDKVSISIISPSGQMTRKLSYKTVFHSGIFNIEDVNYSVTYFYPEILTGDLIATIRLEDVKPGIWTIRLYADYVVNGIHDLYLPPRNMLPVGTRFVKSDPFGTIDLFGVDQNIITVGAYDVIANGVARISSRGTLNQQDTIKPDLVAPGVNIISTFPGGSYNTITGTGASSSIVAGVVSLLLQYFLVDRNSLQSAYTEIIKTYLIAGADTKLIYSYPNVSEGYGLLNIEDTLVQIDLTI